MSEEARRYLETIPDVQQYMASARRMYGHQDTAVVESMNNANLEVRSEHLYGAFQKILKCEQKRFLKKKVKALGYNEPLLPSVSERLSSAQSRAHVYTSIEFTSDDRLTARVPSSSDPAVSYNTDLRLLSENGASCDCGRPQVEGLPCSHLLAHATAGGLEITSFMCRHDTSAGWKEQYSENLEFLLPSDAAIERSTYIDANLRPPIRSRRRKGRPRTRRRRSVLEREENGGRVRRSVTCTNCYRRAHNRRGCPGMPSQNLSAN